MRVPLACMADAATVGADGKLYIMGEFNSIFTTAIPTSWEEMVYVARLEVESGDPRQLQIKVSVLDPDMALIAPQAEIVATMGQGTAGILECPPLVVKIVKAVFKEFGRYTVELRINGKVEASTYIHILSVPVPGPRP